MVVNQKCSKLSKFIKDVKIQFRESDPIGIVSNAMPLYLIPSAVKVSRNIFHGLDFSLNVFLALQVAGIDLTQQRPLIIWPSLAETVHTNIVRESFAQNRAIYSSFASALGRI